MSLKGDAYRHYIVAVYTQSGTKLIGYTYDAFGNVSITYYNGGASSPAAYNPFTYRGYYYDAETGLYYLQSRYYDPKVGRFINADSVDYLGADGTLLSYNLYAYCGNNPVNKMDKTGNLGLAIGIFIGVSSIIGGLAGAFTAACTGGNVLEGALEGAALGAVASTATIVVPLMIPSAGAAITFGASFIASAASGKFVDYITQRISHEFSENSHKEFDLNEGRLIKTGFTTGIAGVVPTFGNPGASLLESTEALVIGFDASFINAVIEIILNHIF